MTKKEIRSRALFLMQEGKSKQEAFDELLPTAGHTADELAGIMRFVPSPRAREKYLTVHIFLIIAMCIVILLKMLAGVSMFLDKPGASFILIFLLPALNVWFTYSLIRYQGSAYRLVAILALLSFIRSAPAVIRDFNILSLPELVLIVVIAGLGFFLNKRMVPAVTETRENYTDEYGRIRLRKKFILPD
ncbi:MAG: hypothetical protein IBJ09_05205 [Bacteroidia bacterium]|nr:hypothetical protein [Bacteroidia bacterium]